VTSSWLPVRISFVLKTKIEFPYVMESCKRRQALDIGFGQVVSFSKSCQPPAKQGAPEQRLTTRGHIGAMID